MGLAECPSQKEESLGVLKQGRAAAVAHLGPRMKRLRFQGVVFAYASNLLEALQQIYTVNFARAVIALVKEMEREEIFLASISISVGFREPGW